MESFKAKIQELEKDLSALNAEVSDVYRELGASLLSETHLTATDKLEEWTRLRERREGCSKDIVKIKTAQDRLEELRQFSKQVQKRKHTQEKEIDQAKKAFTRALYEQYKDVDFAPFAVISDELDPLKLQLETINAESEALKNEERSKSFFKKLTAVPKEQTIKLKRNRIHHAIDALVIKRMNEILLELAKYPTITTSFSSKVDELYRTLEQMADGFSESENKENEYQHEKELIEHSLQDLSGESSASVRIQELTTEATDLDNEIDAIEKGCGIDYVNLFYDDKGGAIQSDVSETDESQKYIKTLETIAQKRRTLYQAHIKIESEKVRMDIATKENTIQHANTSIENYTKKIDEYTQLIQTANETIDSAVAEKEALLQRLATLEEKLQ